MGGWVPWVGTCSDASPAAMVGTQSVVDDPLSVPKKYSKTLVKLDAEFIQMNGL